MVFIFFNKNRWLFIVGAVAMALPHAYAQQDIEPTEDETVMQTEESLPVNPLNPANQQKVYKRTKVKNFKDEAKYKIITKQATMPEKYDVGSPDVASMHKVDAMVLANTAYPDLPNVDIPLTLTETTPSVSSKPLLVRTESVTGKEQALLEKVKAEKLTKQAYAEKNVALITATDAQTPDEQSQYKLTPSESVIKAERSRVVAKPKVKSAEDIYIDKLEFNQANMLDVSRALADISGLNFVATEEAAKKNVTVFLQNISVKNALEAITKNAGLWYRKDKESGTYRIMSTKEYQQDLVVYREDTTRVFNLLHPNPIIVATAIRDLYGDRVILSMGAEDQTFMPMLSGNGGTVNSQTTTNISSSRRGTSSRNAQSNTNITRQNVTFSNGRNNSSRNQDNSIRDDLTPDQLEKLGDTLAERGDVYTLTSDELRGINNREQPIYVTLNREHDLMLVRTTDNSVIKDIEKLVKEMDRPTKQVLLEMKILSLDVGDSYRQSMDLDYMPSSDPVRGPFTNQDRNPLFDESPINVTNTTTTGTTTSTQSGSYTVGVRNILGLGNFALEGGTFVYQFLSDKIRARIQLLQQNRRA